MTAEELKMLTDLANRIAQTPSPQRDAEAEDFIRTRIGNRPDALYLMTQTVLIQNMALDHAKQEIEKLKQQPQQEAPRSSAGGAGFLAGQPPQYQQPQGGYAPQPSYAPPPPQQQAPPTSGMGSFLRSAGTTAAGVAAGALAFEGIRSLFGGGGITHAAGFGEPHLGGGSSFLGGAPETIINNYYETAPSKDDSDDDDSTDADDTDTDTDQDDSTVDADDSADADDSDYDDSSSSDDDSL